MKKHASPKAHYRRSHMRKYLSGKRAPVRGHHVNGQRRKT